MSQEDPKNDNFSWEMFCNDNYGNLEGDKIVNVPKMENDHKGKKHSEEMCEHDLHLLIERDRRKKMRNLFLDLHSLLPHLPPKTDKATIVDEAIHSIKTLESTLARLQKQKQEMLQGTPPSSVTNEPSLVATSRLSMLIPRETFMANQVCAMNNKTSNVARASGSTTHLPVVIQTWTSNNVVLNICGNDAQFVVYVAKNNSALLTTICCILEKHKLEVLSANILSDVDRCTYMIQARVADGACDQFPEIMTVEEVFKQAAAEMMLWVAS